MRVSRLDPGGGWVGSEQLQQREKTRTIRSPHWPLSRPPDYHHLVVLLVHCVGAAQFLLADSLECHRTLVPPWSNQCVWDRSILVDMMINKPTLYKDASTPQTLRRRLCFTCSYCQVAASPSQATPSGLRPAEHPPMRPDPGEPVEAPQLDGASKLSKLVDHEHPEIGFSRRLRCWECLDQRSTTDPHRCGKRCCGSWPGSILSIRSMPATPPSSGPARFEAFITAETGGLGPHAVPSLWMSVPNRNQIVPAATKSHCCACGFEICVPVYYTGTQSLHASRRAALME